MKTITKCNNADKYKAIRKSKCTCYVCTTKWEMAQMKREIESLKKILVDTNKSARYASSSANAALYVANLHR